MNNLMCVVGVGAVTAIGLNSHASAASVRAGIANFNEHPFMIDRMGDPYVLAMVPFLDATAMGAERYIRMALPAIQEALAPLSGLDTTAQKVAVQIGLPELRPGFPQDVKARFSNDIHTLSDRRVKVAEPVFIEKGHSAGLMAMEAAKRMILSRTYEFCLAGGIDSYVNPETLDWIEENEQLHISSNAWGFIPGEAASFCLLCSQETAEKYRLPVRAQVVAINTEQEQNKIKTETVCTGQGLTRAVKRCIQELPSACRIDYVICDQNGEAYRSDEFGFMLARLSESFVNPSDYMAPADCWGDVGAASGPLFVNLLVAAAEKRYAKGRYTLLWTSSEGGERSAAVVSANIKERGMG